MDIVLLIARLTLAGVFAVAGGAKLLDREGSRRALAGFDVPDFLVGPSVWGLPAVEILIALALIPLGTAWAGAIGAAGLLLTFVVVIGVNLARGKSPDCHCFGQLHSEPVSWSLAARNLGLAAVAGLIVALGRERPGISALDWVGEVSAGEWAHLVFSVFAAGMSVSVFMLLRKSLAQQATLSETVTALKKLIDEDYAEPDPIERADAEPPAEGLPVGALAPAFSLRTLDGGQVSLRDLLAIGRPVLLLFVSPSCSPCKSLLPVIRVWERDYGAQLTIALLSKGSVRDVQAKLAKYEVRRLLLQGESTIADDYQAKWTPAAVLIGPDGKIASPVLAGDDAIKSLVNHTVAVGAFLPTENQGVGIDARRPRITAQIRVGNSLFRVGEPAPKFALPDLRGKSVNTETLLGRETLLLFWDADCPFCRAMADDLNQWEEASSNGAPRLVYVVSGDVEAARGKHQGLKSLTLIDEDFDIGPLFGTDSAPSGILIDGEGNIASGLAKGARNILALLGIRKVELPIAPASARASAKEASQGAVGESAAK